MIPNLRAAFILSLIACATVSSAADSAPGEDAFAKSVQPFLATNCYLCHNSKTKTADLNLTAFGTASSVAKQPELWEKVETKLRDGTMPPKGLPRPRQSDVDAVAKWIADELSRAERAAKPDPGRVTARRLNRAEYNNTVRDLLGVDFRPADDFPQDDSGYGFDNIADVLSLSPVLLEKYLKAAESVVHAAVFGPEALKPTVLRSQPPGHEFPLRSTALTDYDVTGLSLPSALHANMRFPADGEYLIRAALEGRRPNGSEPLHIGIWLDGKQVHIIDIDAPSDGQS
ncbi:MAG: Gluconolactonase, partial [Bryobacterales bacterium]|nr:Gluconolactonase [Bryobacterales bacterium]